jgi:putative DNA primase/helicase
MGAENEGRHGVGSARGGGGQKGNQTSKIISRYGDSVNTSGYLSDADLLRAVLARLDRGDAPASQWPDRAGRYWPLCPFHNDRHTGSFHVSTRGYWCNSCNTHGSLYDLARRLGVLEPKASAPAPRAKAAPAAPAKAKRGATMSNLTLADYAQARHLDIMLLRSYDISEQRNERGVYLAMPYMDRRGQVVAVRYRYALTGDRRFGWRKGDQPVLYGLWHIEGYIREQGWVLLVEGESDCHMAWQWNIPALGVPGASSWQTAYARSDVAELLNRAVIYVWMEPDKGGAALVSAVARTFPDALVLVPPADIKDLCEAALKYSNLATLVDQLRDTARPAETVALAEAEADGDDDAPRDGQAKGRRGFYPRPYSLEIMGRYEFLATSTTARGDFYVYDEQSGLWRDGAADLIASFFRDAELLDDEQKKRYAIDEIVADVRGMAWQRDGLPTPDVRLIPFKNGVYDLNADALRAYRPEDGFTWQLPWRYNPNARSSYLSRYLVNFSDEVQVHAYELLAYCLWRDYPYQRFFMWHGRGSNGKSWLASVLRHALGVRNVASLTLADIQTNRFAAAELRYKLANVAGEVAYSDLTNTDLLKRLTGGDYLQAERKYHDPVPFQNYAKLIFLTNEVPATRDTTDAFYRRAFLVQFDQQFQEAPDVLAELQRLIAAGLAGEPDAAGEFEWLLALAVATLHDLKARGFVMTGHRSADETREAYEALSNPLRQFLEEHCVRTLKADDLITKQELVERFNAWLSERGRNAHSAKRVAQMMRQLGAEEGRRDGLRGWLGWTWR